MPEVARALPCPIERETTRSRGLPRWLDARAALNRSSRSGAVLAALHLVGVYEATTKNLSLYVDGRLTATRAYTGTTWNAAGPLQIGRRLYQGTYGEYANGQGSDIHIYNTALPPADAAATGDNHKLTQLG
ncbi:LamG-like jellyroll fold domain-containing protein [Streptomyces sp. Tue6028]|uniref:LamG-like jellyroll fold domain-containing protein n=1 Tax=Streptomyces sp. Tue6028 TaxID=2036037 RepID=UPI003EB8E97E